MSGVGGCFRLRGAPRKQLSRARSKRHREAWQEEAEDPPFCCGAGLRVSSEGRNCGRQRGSILSANECGLFLIPSTAPRPKDPVAARKGKLPGCGNRVGAPRFTRYWCALAQENRDL